jgi:hypothetical protein
MAKQTWTQEEVEALRRMYPDPCVSKESMEQHFGRSWGAIGRKASRFGLERPRERSWSSEEITDLRGMYSDLSISIEQMVEHLGRSKHSITGMACELDIKRRKTEVKHWSKAEKELLSKLYTDKSASPQYLESVFKRSSNAITKQARTCGLFRYDHQINHEYFQNITTDEQAYWLGWLASDGSVRISKLNGLYISLEIQARDEIVVQAFKQAVAPGLTVHRNRNAVSVRIGSKRMAQDLAFYGIVPNKTEIFDWPHALPETFSISFILGYFDGDGCLYRKTSISRNDWRWYLLGTQPFLKAVRQRIELYAQVTLPEPVRADKHRCPFLYKLCTSNKEIIRRIDAMLNTSGLGLPRKHL